MTSSALGTAAARRLVFMVAWLLVIDGFVPAILQYLEHRRYESHVPFRFEGSDFFGLGPLVAYLKENPRADRGRTVFMGNSVIFGFKLPTDEALPGVFEQLNPQTRVFNLAINNLETGSSYLIAKEIVESVDLFVVLLAGDGAAAVLPRLIEVDPADLVRFGLRTPDSSERALTPLLNRWQLYRDSYRLQNALFGSSTRMYIYQHKADLPRRVLARISRSVATRTDGQSLEANAPPAAIQLEAPMASRPPDVHRTRELAARHRLLLDFARLITAHGKRVVFLDFLDYWKPLPKADCADINAIIGRNATVLQVAVPQSLRLDTAHLTATGSLELASALSSWLTVVGEAP